MEISGLEASIENGVAVPRRYWIVSNFSAKSYLTTEITEIAEKIGACSRSLFSAISAISVVKKLFPKTPATHSISHRKSCRIYDPLWQK